MMETLKTIKFHAVGDLHNIDKTFLLIAELSFEHLKNWLFLRFILIDFSSLVLPNLG